jgi:vacuolar-type H+-ATPase subunit I/STV1
MLDELTKKCRKCGEVRELECFPRKKSSRDGKQGACKACRAEYQKEYGQRSEVKDRHRKRQQIPGIKIKAKMRRELPEVKVKIKNRAQTPEVKAQRKEYSQTLEAKTRRRERHKERMATDPIYRLARNLRRRINLGLKGQSKSKKTERFLGCTFEETMVYLEKSFRPPMTRENMGKIWHVDHIRPVCSFDLSDPEQVKACFHYTNLQPLFVEENLKKSGKY